jgi:menaquinone-9 beta-reductase
LKRLAVVIVGGGPAGASAAIQLAARSPECVERTLLLDRAIFPRDKLCGGGVVRQADRLLFHLGVRIDVPSVPIDRLRFEDVAGHSTLEQKRAFRVVRRDEFDHALLNEVKARGIEVHEGEGVRELQRIDGGIRVTTDQREYETRVVIGADGANGIVRRSLVPSRRHRRFVALEVFTSRADREASADASRSAVFDFAPAARGLRGYYWDFPSVCGGEPRMNRGIGGSSWSRSTSLRALFDEELTARDQAASDGDLHGATIPIYDPSLPQSSPHVVLAGDAVGVDPWLGEGISVAVGTGMLAAHATAEAFARDAFGFPDHRTRIRNSAVGKQIRRNRIIARQFYRAALRGDRLATWFGTGARG